LTPANTELQTHLQEYAKLIIRSGCNLQPGQELLLSCNIDVVEFARLLVAEAYAAGAKRVTVRFSDEQIVRMAYENVAIECFKEVPEWVALLNNSMARNGAAILRIESDDPQALEGIDPQKLAAQAVASHKACKEFYDAIDQGRLVWSIAGAASPAWARKVFPDMPEDQAVRSLWEAILKTVRVGGSDDAIVAWENHRTSFTRRSEWLNAQNFDSLHYQNSLGTDLTVGLNPKGIWKGGGDILTNGRPFFPNMPTEEIFTTPDRLRADGVVHSSMPLVHNGSIVEDFSVTFRDGQAVDCKARVGLDILKSIIETDADSNRLGECALVPWTSPIRQSGLLFYSTLYDENASCHLALGMGFPDCLEGGTEMSEDELKANGVNKSATHVDFMIGTKDLNITGHRPDGSEATIFQAGEWAGELV
jgi:aminopeptidase